MNVKDEVDELGRKVTLRRQLPVGDGSVTAEEVEQLRSLVIQEADDIFAVDDEEVKEFEHEILTPQ